MGQVSQFLGVEFHRVKHADDHLSVTPTQQSFTESLIDSFGTIIITIISPFSSSKNSFIYVR
jgi:hypothetical protein